jgi:hypothetical protein
VSNAELDESVEIYIWDTTREELEVMVQHPDGGPMALDAAKLMASINTTANWSLVATDLSISATDTDVILAAKLASITYQFGSPIITGAASELYGCSTSIVTSADSDERLPTNDPTLVLWQQLRRSSMRHGSGSCHLACCSVCHTAQRPTLSVHSTMKNLRLRIMGTCYGGHPP